MQIMETRKEKHTKYEAQSKAQTACTNRLTSASNPYIMKLFFNNPCQD